MGDRELAIGVGIAQGLEKAASNMMNIRMAREKLQKEQKQFDLDLKIKNLQLQKLEGDLDPERIKLEKETLNSQAKSQQARYKYWEAKSQQAERDAQTQLDEGQRYQEIFDKVVSGEMPGTDFEVKYNKKSGTSYSVKSAKGLSNGDKMKLVNMRDSIFRELEDPKIPDQRRVNLVNQLHQLERIEQGSAQPQQGAGAGAGGGQPRVEQAGGPVKQAGGAVDPNKVNYMISQIDSQEKFDEFVKGVDEMIKQGQWTEEEKQEVIKTLTGE